MSTTIEDVQLEILNLGLSKETALIRGIYAEAAVTTTQGIEFPVAVAVTIAEAEFDNGLPEDFFSFELSEDTEVIEWDPEPSVKEAMQAYEAAVLQRGGQL